MKLDLNTNKNNDPQFIVFENYFDRMEKEADRDTNIRMLEDVKFLCEMRLKRFELDPKIEIWLQHDKIKNK